MTKVAEFRLWRPDLDYDLQKSPELSCFMSDLLHGIQMMVCGSIICRSVFLLMPETFMVVFSVGNLKL